MPNELLIYIIEIGDGRYYAIEESDMEYYGYSPEDYTSFTAVRDNTFTGKGKAELPIEIGEVCYTVDNNVVKRIK